MRFHLALSLFKELFVGTLTRFDLFVNFFFGMVKRSVNGRLQPT